MTLKKKRAVLFAFEGGTGVGHLRRIACIAKALEKQFACLIVTGHRAIADWFVSSECEYVHIPSWDSLLVEKSSYWLKQPFLTLTVDEALKLRKRMITGIVSAFDPDLIIVDHLPLGMNGELEEVVARTSCLKYLVTRGVLNRSRGRADLVVGDHALDTIRTAYDRVLVAADSRVVDFANEYDLPHDVAQKTISVGYAVDRIHSEAIRTFRSTHRPAPNAPWVVVSAGGGQLGERLIMNAVELSKRYPDVHFDIVAGPRSNLQSQGTEPSPINSNVRFQWASSDMAMLNASADILICSGGYNSLMEGLQGRARILTVPNWTDPLHEQTRHSQLLQRFADIRIVSENTSLETAFGLALADPVEVADLRSTLDFSGGDTIREIAAGDT